MTTKDFNAMLDDLYEGYNVSLSNDVQTITIQYNEHDNFPFYSKELGRVFVECELFTYLHDWNFKQIKNKKTMNKNDNEVTNFMYYMYNVWNKSESIMLFGENLGSYIYDKWLMTGRDKDLLFYSMLDNECRQKLVGRANEYYNK